MAGVAATEALVSADEALQTIPKASLIFTLKVTLSPASSDSFDITFRDATGAATPDTAIAFDLTPET